MRKSISLSNPPEVKPGFDEALELATYLIIFGGGAFVIFMGALPFLFALLVN